MWRDPSIDPIDRQESRKRDRIGVYYSSSVSSRRLVEGGKTIGKKLKM